MSTVDLDGNKDFEARRSKQRHQKNATDAENQFPGFESSRTNDFRIFRFLSFPGPELLKVRMNFKLVADLSGLRQKARIFYEALATKVFWLYLKIVGNFFAIIG